MAKIEFEIRYNMIFPDKTRVTRGRLVLNTARKAEKRLVEQLDKSKGAYRVHEETPVKTAVAILPNGERTRGEVGRAQEAKKAGQAPAPDADQEPNWSFMTKSDLTLWLHTAQAPNQPGPSSSKQKLIQACHEAWADGLRGSTESEEEAA